jgi:hypothetical protein
MIGKHEGFIVDKVVPSEIWGHITYAWHFSSPFRVQNKDLLYFWQNNHSFFT